MKKTIFAAALCVAALLGAAPHVAAQLPGPVVAGSSSVGALPAPAQAFLSKTFPGMAVVKVENDFADRKYEVDLADGTDITFNYQGQWTQIEAPDGVTLPSSLITGLVPEPQVIEVFTGDALLKGGMLTQIDEIEIIPDGYAVEYLTGSVGKAKARVRASDGAIILRSKDKKKAKKHAPKRKKSKIRR